jgi:hypothetical protein
MARSTSTAANNAAVLAKINGYKPRGKATATEQPKPEQAQAADVSEDESVFERARAAMDALFDTIAMPSWTRRLVSTVLSITMSAVVAYGCLSLVDVLILATALYTGSNFLCFIVMFLGIVLTMMASVTVASKAFEVCMQFEYSNAKASVKSWFNGFRKPAAA